MSGRDRIGTDNPLFRAGISHDALGYVTLTSKAWGDNAGRRQHRVIAETFLGRPLERSEIVHHRNHDRSDNRPANLVVMDRSEHPRIHLGLGREIACRLCGRRKWHSPAAEERINPKGYACRACGGRWA